MLMMRAVGHAAVLQLLPAVLRAADAAHAVALSQPQLAGVEASLPSEAAIQRLLGCEWQPTHLGAVLATLEDVDRTSRLGAHHRGALRARLHEARRRAAGRRRALEREHARGARLAEGRAQRGGGVGRARPLEQHGVLHLKICSTCPKKGMQAP